MPEQYDLIVVGGGLGGATLAKCLAEKGARVLVLERQEEFKDRVRGELVTPWGVAEAKQLGIYDLLRERIAHEVPWMDFHSGNTLVAHRDMIGTTPHQQPCLSFYHPALQDLLAQAAASSGAEVRRGVIVGEVRPGAPPTVVVQANGRIEEIRARLVVGADGRSSSVRASAGFEIRRDPEDMMIAGVLLDNVRVHEDTAQIVMHSGIGQMTAIFPQGGGRVRSYLCFHSGTRPRYHGAGDIGRYFEACSETGVGSEVYAAAKVAGPLATFSGAETWVQHPYRAGVALLGDAAASSDPSWGQGLSLTLRDVRVLRDNLCAHQNWDAAGHAYAAEHDRYASAIHQINLWHTELLLGVGAEAENRRSRAMPLIARDPSRQPDHHFSGPDLPADEAVRKRFFAEDQMVGTLV